MNTGLNLTLYIQLYYTRCWKTINKLVPLLILKFISLLITTISFSSIVNIVWYVKSSNFKIYVRWKAPWQQVWQLPCLHTRQHADNPLKPIRISVWQTVRNPSEKPVWKAHMRSLSEKPIWEARLGTPSEKPVWEALFEKQVLEACLRSLSKKPVREACLIDHIWEAHLRSPYEKTENLFIANHLRSPFKKPVWEACLRSLSEKPV